MKYSRKITDKCIYVKTEGEVLGKGDGEGTRGKETCRVSSLDERMGIKPYILLRSRLPCTAGFQWKL